MSNVVVVIVIVAHDRRRPGLPNAQVVIEYYNNRTEI